MTETRRYDEGIKYFTLKVGDPVGVLFSRATPYHIISVTINDPGTGFFLMYDAPSTINTISSLDPSVATTYTYDVELKNGFTVLRTAADSNITLVYRGATLSY